MRTCCAAIVLVFSTVTACFAQDRPATLEGAGSAQGGELQQAKRKAVDRKFFLLAGALNGAMLLDTKSTFDVSDVCPYCREANPFVAPFVRRGPVPTYIAGELFDAGVMTIAAKMRTAERRWARRVWWVIPVALVTGHSIAYRHNVDLINQIK